MNEHEFTDAGSDGSNVQWVRRTRDGAVFGIVVGERFGERKVWLTRAGAGTGKVGETVVTRDTHATMREWESV